MVGRFFLRIGVVPPVDLVSENGGGLPVLLFGFVFCFLGALGGGRGEVGELMGGVSGIVRFDFGVVKFWRVLRKAEVREVKLRRRDLIAMHSLFASLCS